MIRSGISAAVLALCAGVLGGSPAYADTFAVTVTPTTNIPAAGGPVSVSLTGLPANQGVYVVQCATAVVSPRPSLASNCASSNMAWISSNSADWPAALSALTPQVFNVVPTFTVASSTFDCRVTACALFVRRDHNGGVSDFTLDTLVPLQLFTAALTDVVTFGRGGSGLTWFSRQKLSAHLGQYRAASAVTITVKVTKRRGSTSARARHVASARAAAIREFLVASGVDSAHITVRAAVVRMGRASVARVTANP